MRDLWHGWWSQDRAEGGMAPAGDLWLTPEIPRFATVLPYQLHDPELDLYGLLDGTAVGAIGFALEGLPQVGVSEQLANSLQEIPTLLPPDTCLQVSLYADPDVRNQLARFCRLRSGGQEQRATGLHRQRARRRYAHLASQVGELAPRNHRLFFTATVPGSLDDRETVAAMLSLRQVLTTLLAGCSIPTKCLPPAELVQLVGSLLNPSNPGRRQFGYADGSYVREQCLLQDTEIEVGTGTITVRGDGAPHALVAMVVSKYPATMSLDGMLGLLGDPVRPNLRYRGPYLITLGMQALDQEEARMLVSLKSARAVSNANSAMAWLMPGHYRRQHQDWRTCAEVIDNGGQMVLMSHQVLVQSSLADLPEAVESARSVWRSRGFTLSRCEYLQVCGLLAALPLSLTPGSAQDLRRIGWLGRKTSHNVAHGMPVVAEWKGTHTPSLLLVGRRGQLMNLDIFEAGNNHNVLVAGASGSGKSVLLNEIATTAVSLGDKVWVLDIGRSYQHSCEYLGGEFIQFGLDNTMSLNPFSAIVDINDDMRLLKPLFAQMIAPQRGLGDYERARLEEALLSTWERRGTAATPTCVRDELARLGRSDSRISDMATMLGQFTRDGLHGRWFNEPATIDLSADFVVLELEDLKSWPELQVVVFLQLLFLISQQMYGSRDQRKLVIIDEAWDLLRGEHIAEFIEHGYRRSRKYNGAFLSASQSVADFHAHPAGRAALANSDWLMLLEQRSEELNLLVEGGKLDLHDAELALLRSLHTLPGQYSEVFIRVAGVASAVGRLNVDAHSQLLYSTTAADRQALAQLRAEGMDLAQAIDSVLAARGVVHAQA